MTKIKEVSESIKSKLNFDDYEPSVSKDGEKSENKDIKTAQHNDIKKSKKIKRTFYLLEEVAEQLDDFYAKKLGERIKIDKSDIVTQAIKNLLEDENADVKEY